MRRVQGTLSVLRVLSGRGPGSHGVHGCYFGYRNPELTLLKIYVESSEYLVLDFTNFKFIVGLRTFYYRNMFDDQIRERYTSV